MGIVEGNFRPVSDIKEIPKHICLLEKLPPDFQENFQYDLDEKIWPLVRILNLKDIPTFASCEGHYTAFDRDYLCPWVNIRPDVPVERINALDAIIRQYNSLQSIPWTIHTEKEQMDPIRIKYYSLFPTLDAPISTLQENVLILSRYIDAQIMP
jgi:hypothetical protein